MIVHYAGEEDEANWPVAVRLLDRHGLVTSVRIAPDGKAFYRAVSMSKGHLRAEEENWPEELRADVKDIRETRRVFLEGIEGDEVVVYCSKAHGEHQVVITAAELRVMVAEFKAGHPTFKLYV